jgi:hypothetical protein
LASSFRRCAGGFSCPPSGTTVRQSPGLSRLGAGPRFPPRAVTGGAGRAGTPSCRDSLVASGPHLIPTSTTRRKRDASVSATLRTSCHLTSRVPSQSHLFPDPPRRQHATAESPAGSVSSTSESGKGARRELPRSRQKEAASAGGGRCCPGNLLVTSPTHPNQD